MTGRLTVKNGKYYVVISYSDGRINKQKWVATGLDEKNNKREATEALREIVANFEAQAKYGNTATSIVNKKDSPLFGDYLKSWLEAAKPNLQLTTYGSYQKYINNIAPYFNERKIILNSLTPSDIRDYYAYLTRDEGKSVHNCLHRHTIMRRALEIAYRTDMIQTNPMDKVERPKVAKYNAKFYDLKQLKALFDCIQGDRFELLYKMTAFYGLRRSEICGLKWKSINFNDNLIHINHAVVQISIDGKLMRVCKDMMKNQSSKRTMPLIPEIKDMLLAEKNRQERNLSRYGEQYFLKDSDYIFVDDLGKLASPNTVSAHFQMILARNGLPKIRFHELRHSCASLLIACGVGMKEVQEWLGHSAMSTTVDNQYGHTKIKIK